MKDSILATDISCADTVRQSSLQWGNHLKELRKLSSSANSNSSSSAGANTSGGGLMNSELSSECRRLLIKQILLCSDIGIVREPFDIYIHGVKLLFQEVDNMTTQDRKAFFNGQLCFLEGYASEVLEQLKQVPVLNECVSAWKVQLNKNMSELVARGSDVIFQSARRDSKESLLSTNTSSGGRKRRKVL